MRTGNTVAARVPVLASSILVALALAIGSCDGWTWEEREAKAKKEREVARQEQERARQERLIAAGSKFDAVPFTGVNLPDVPFTIDFQRFVQKHAPRPLVFEAFVEDVEDTASGPVVTVSNPLDRMNVLLDGPTVVLRLRADTAHVERILAARPSGHDLLQRIRFLRELDCVVVARVEGIRRARLFEVRAGALEEEAAAQLDIEGPSRFIGYGRLLDVVILPRELPRASSNAGTAR